jgi:DNA-binding GntR family transcriptional regulator
MPVPDPRDPRPAYQQIADDLKAAIKDGRLQPGDRLPTEREHAGRYGVAVGTYRHALSVLRQEGWLATHKRHGTVVVRPEESPSPEYVELSARLDQIERHVSQLARQVGQISPAPSAGLAIVLPRSRRTARLDGKWMSWLPRRHLRGSSRAWRR